MTVSMVSSANPTSLARTPPPMTVAKSGSASIATTAPEPNRKAQALICSEQSQPTRLPTERQAAEDIKKMMPEISQAMVDGGNSPNKANCDIAAGKTLAKLREKGYDARLVSSGSHVTVRVRTQGKDLVVDPTMRQFFKDGSPIDNKLKKEGGFVGTESQLKATLRDNHADFESTKFNTPSEAQLRKDLKGDPHVTEKDIQEHVRDVLVPDFVDKSTERFFKGIGETGLTKEARNECMRTIRG